MSNKEDELFNQVERNLASKKAKKEANKKKIKEQEKLEFEEEQKRKGKASDLAEKTTSFLLSELKPFFKEFETNGWSVNIGESYHIVDHSLRTDKEGVVFRPNLFHPGVYDFPGFKIRIHKNDKKFDAKVLPTVRVEKKVKKTFFIATHRPYYEFTVTFSIEMRYLRMPPKVQHFTSEQSKNGLKRGLVDFLTKIERSK